MKIATWNVNSLKVRLPQLLQWLQDNPEVGIIGIQETKLEDAKFPQAELENAGWYCAFLGQKTYNGVALLSRWPLTHVQRNMPDFADEQARFIAASVEPALKAPNDLSGLLAPALPRLRIINTYFVNGQAPDSEKFIYKMNWLQHLSRTLRTELDNLQHNEQLILMGDFNVAPTDADSFDPEGLRGTIHHTAQEREHFAHMLSMGMVDAFRLFEQPERSFSWWDYRQLGFQKNRGLRIDHILITPGLQKLALSCKVDRNPRKNPQPSDHAPVVLELAAH